MRANAYPTRGSARPNLTTLKRAVVVSSTVLAVVVLVDVAVATSDEGFQGLPWGATESQIEARFPGLLQRRSCNPRTQGIYDHFNTRCDYLYIENYEVAGIPFRLDFGQHKVDSTMVSVDLSYSAPGARQPKSNENPSPTSRDTTERAYRTVLQLLKNRYGPTHAGGETERDGIFVGNWKWRTPSTEISLTFQFSPAGRYADARHELRITYLPVVGADARRL